ncbi:hypothetical protein [Ideonella sp.]|jgi:hypothetical protein
MRIKTSKSPQYFSQHLAERRNIQAFCLPFSNDGADDLSCDAQEG